eukprot:5012436-Prorocentrum_lima.AAC.1
MKVPTPAGSNHRYQHTNGSQSSTSGGTQRFRDEPDRIQRKAYKACSMVGDFKKEAAASHQQQ